MATTIVEPVMGLIIPTVGTNGDPGPDYANNQNQDLYILASHTHGLGSGLQVTPTGLNINTNLPFNNNSATSIYGIQFSAPSPSSLLAFLYTNAQSGGGITDLFFNDGAGNIIPLTKAGEVNATIASLPGESYSGGTFTWKQGAGSTTPANFDIGSITIRPNTAGTTNGVVLGPPSGISSLFNVQLPPIPSNPGFLAIDTSGNMSATIPISGGLTTTNISATAGILRSQLASAGQQISASCGSFIQSPGSGGGSAAVTNLSVTLVTTGRPVMVFLQPSNASYAYSLIGPTATAQVLLGIQSNGTAIASVQLNSNYSNGTAITNTQFGSTPVLMALDTPAAGSNTYSAFLSYAAFCGGGVTNYVLVAYEL